MHPAVGNYSFVLGTLTHVTAQLNQNTSEVRDAIGKALGTTDPAIIESQRVGLASRVGEAKQLAAREQSHQDVHYVSRFDGVGLFQSILSELFSDIPDLQGYGDKNPAWLTTIIEETEYRFGAFFKNVYNDVHGNKQSLLHSIISGLHQLRYESAVYPSGTPRPIPIPENTTIRSIRRLGRG